LREGALKIKGEIPATILDNERPSQVKVLARVVVPVEATVQVPAVRFAIPALD
jgi:hypothetical protein